MVFKWHKRFRDERASINDDERPGRPTEIGDVMIDDIRHAVQEDGRITRGKFRSRLTYPHQQYIQV